MFLQPDLELESMTQKISTSRPNSRMNVYLLAFTVTLVAPIIAALSMKIKLVLCAFLASVVATSMALVSAMMDRDVDIVMSTKVFPSREGMELSCYLCACSI